MSLPASKQRENTVFWWMGWITLTILTFFLAAWFWTGVIASRYGTMDRPGAPALWVAAVFGSWMLLLVPLIVVMYNKVDRAYEDVRLAREAAASEKARKGFTIRSILVEEPDRLLPKAAAKNLKSVPETIRQGYQSKGHLVTAVLKDGRRVDNVFVLDREQVLGVYDRTTLDFRIADIVELIPADLDRLPAFRPEKWLRLDGKGTSP